MGRYEFNKNTIYVGDCKDVLKDFPEECVDLIYLDPPFFTNRNYEIIWDDGAEKRAFEDRWKGGINQYIEWMKERIEPIYHILKDTGSFYLHCDWHASHYLKVALDGIFGRENFLNEIIWHYNRWTNVSNNFQRRHDSLLFYSKQENSNLLKKTKEKSTNKIYHTNTVGSGGERITQLLVYDKEKFDELENREELINKYDRVVEVDKMGYYDDVWDISIINSQAKERMGYPTQKPKELLKRIIKASSNKGDLVLDPFCGCGTTVAAAEELERDWIGIDVSPTACSVMNERLKSRQGIDALIVGIPQTVDDLKKIQYFDFENWAIRAFDGKQTVKTRDKGIDGFAESGLPLQIKQSEGVGRTSVDQFKAAIERIDEDKGTMVGFSFTKTAYEEVARLKRKEGIGIELKEVSDLLGELKYEKRTPSMMFAKPKQRLLQEWEDES